MSAVKDLHLILGALVKKDRLGRLAKRNSSRSTVHPGVLEISLLQCDASTRHSEILRTPG